MGDHAAGMGHVFEEDSLSQEGPDSQGAKPL